MSELQQMDSEIAALITKEEARQHRTMRLIPSENYAWPAVMEACGSVLNNKYSEGYTGKRYYEGQEFIDGVESLAVERVKALFGVDHANVQPYSGSPANLAVYFAFCQPGDTVMGMGLPSGGHLTHGWKVSISGSYFNAVQYGVRESDHRIDFDQVASLAREHKPKLLFCGATAYPRQIDFARFAEIAREVGAILVADIAHISGLIAGGAHPSPVGLAEVISSTTHKTLRGPRGGMIMCDAKHAKAIDKSVFPGLQGGPHNGTTAGIAVAAKLAGTPEFKQYAANVVTNAQALAARLEERGFALITRSSWASRSSARRWATAATSRTTVTRPRTTTVVGTRRMTTTVGAARTTRRSIESSASPEESGGSELRFLARVVRGAADLDRSPSTREAPATAGASSYLAGGQPPRSAEIGGE